MACADHKKSKNQCYSIVSGHRKSQCRNPYKTSRVRRPLGAISEKAAAIHQKRIWLSVKLNAGCRVEKPIKPCVKPCVRTGKQPFAQTENGLREPL